MGYKLTGDQFRAVCKKFGEIQRQLSQADYPFNPDELLAALNALMEGRFNAVDGGFPSAVLAAKYGYTVVEDVATPTDFRVKDMEFISFMETSETVVDGNTMRSRAVTLNANFGLCDAPRLLDQQADIPVEERSRYIVLAGTKLRDRYGVLCVACLFFDGGQWCLSFDGLGGVWDERGRFPRCK